MSKDSDGYFIIVFYIFDGILYDSFYEGNDRYPYTYRRYCVSPDTMFHEADSFGTFA